MPARNRLLLCLNTAGLVFRACKHTPGVHEKKFIVTIR